MVAGDEGEPKEEPRKRRRVLAIALLIVPLAVIGVCCWQLSRPVDPEWGFQQMMGIQTRFAESYATHVPEVTPAGVADSIYYVYNDVVEIGLFAVDFVGTRVSADETHFSGRIVNLGDRRVTGIRATIWLQGEDGSTVDGVPIVDGPAQLEPGEALPIEAIHMRGENLPRLLFEAIYLSRDRSYGFESYYGHDVVLSASLDGLAGLLPWARYEAVWTTPEHAWQSWTVDLTCDGEGAW